MRFYELGVTEHDATRATPGFTLFSPLVQNRTYLINMLGEIVHSWELPHKPGNYTYLLPNGNLLAATYTDAGPKWFNAKGGRLQEIDWVGNVVWEYVDDNQHHDFRRLDNSVRNGNWEKTTYQGIELQGKHVGLIGFGGFCWLQALNSFTFAINTEWCAGMDAANGFRWLASKT